MKSFLVLLYILFFILGCGVKGAPMPKQEESYIYGARKENSLDRKAPDFQLKSTKETEEKNVD